MIALEWEWKILEWFYQIGNPFLNYLFWLISELGSTIGALLAITIIYWCINKEQGRKIAFICFTSIVFNNILKAFFQRKRPFQHENKEYLRKLSNTSLNDSATGTSFPSGHSQNSGALFSSLFLEYRNKKILRSLFIIMLILVPISRLYLGVHFPSDVILGSLWGILTALLLLSLQNNNKIKEAYLHFSVLLLVVPFLFLNNAGMDLFKGYGLLMGFVIGNFLEEKKINFVIAKEIKTNILRYLTGLIIVAVLFLAVNKLVHISFFDSHMVLKKIVYVLSHFIITFSAATIVPLIFKKWSLLQDKEKNNE